MGYILPVLKCKATIIFSVTLFSISPLLTTYCNAADLSDKRISMDDTRNGTSALQRQVSALHPLSSNDAMRIRAAFADQSAGHFDSADVLLQQVEDRSLTGTVLAERCLHTSYACPIPMLENWLTHYSDLPATPIIQTLLDARKDLPIDLSAQPVGASFSATQAQNLYIQGQDQVVLTKALNTPALNDKSGKVAFYAGLSAWRLGEARRAQAFFVSAATSTDKNAKDLRSAAAWWASRTMERVGNTKASLLWLMQSARCRDCFYGVLARHALKKNEAQIHATDAPAAADPEFVSTNPTGHRALALLQVGRTDLAEAELLTEWVDAKNPYKQQSVKLIAHTVDSASGSFAATHSAGKSALVPGHSIDLPQRFAPRGGFIVDPALIYGIISIESRFQPGVVSKSGARGLMQLMPGTAANFANSQKESLNDPSFNLLVGQRYLIALAQDNHINNHLIRLLASYAVGHTTVAHWNASARSQNDSLAFLEAIPKAQVKSWIKTVLLHSWMYSEKLQRRAASLDSLADGKRARLPLETETSFH